MTNIISKKRISWMAVLTPTEIRNVIRAGESKSPETADGRDTLLFWYQAARQQGDFAMADRLQERASRYGLHLAFMGQSYEAHRAKRPTKHDDI